MVNKEKAMDTMAAEAQALWENWEQEYFINHQWDNPTEAEWKAIFETEE